MDSGKGSMKLRKNEGEFLRRWEKFKSRWKSMVPIISVDKFIYETVRDFRKEYPTWEKVIEDIEPDDDGFKILGDYIRELWNYILRWF